MRIVCPTTNAYVGRVPKPDGKKPARQVSKKVCLRTPAHRSQSAQHPRACASSDLRTHGHYQHVGLRGSYRYAVTLSRACTACSPPCCASTRGALGLEPAMLRVALGGSDAGTRRLLHLPNLSPNTVNSAEAVGSERGQGLGARRWFQRPQPAHGYAAPRHDCALRRRRRRRAGGGIKPSPPPPPAEGASESTLVRAARSSFCDNAHLPAG